MAQILSDFNTFFDDEGDVVSDQDEIKTISILGSTGSIGENTLDIIRHFPQKFDVQLLTAQNSADKLIAQAKEFMPHQVVIGNEDHYNDVKSALADLPIEVSAGRKALIDAAGEDVDITMAAIVGVQGLEPTASAIRGSESLALANKESLVCAGSLLTDLAHQMGTMILPVDSEHNAIFQCLGQQTIEDVEQIILTASGGPFYDMTRDQMASMKASDAIKHPRWKMGAKISIDCATLVNKALEVIEAHHLFDLSVDQIKVLVHRQSLVHSLVEYKDGSLLAQMGPSDMRVPISYALSWPERFEYAPKRLDLKDLSSLTFEEPNLEKFPLLSLGWESIKSGQSYSLAFNSANEVAVEALMQGQIKFLDIEKIIFKTIESFNHAEPKTLEDVFVMDQEVRRIAKEHCSAL